MNPTNPRPALDVVQRWMQSAVMHPDGVVAGINSDAARKLIDVGADEVGKVLTRSRALTAAERLAIYGSAYYARLLDCMREEFPVLKHALGEELFDAFSFGYLQQCPSQSYTLVQLGARFPGFLAETRPQREGDEGSADWADFLIDLASLELAFNEIFDGPGVEGQQLLDPEQLGAVPADRWPDARLVPVPCLRLLSFRYPVQDYFAAVRADESPDVPEPADVFLAVTRRNYVVRHFPLSRTEHALLQALAAGAPVGGAIEQVAGAAGADLDQLAANLHAWFRRWAMNGFFQGVEVP